MSVPQRLPIVGQDDGTWGDIIRQFLMDEHYNDDTNNAANGGHQNVTIRPGTTSAAPLTFATGGSLLSTPAAGSVEYASDTLYFTVAAGSNTRKKIAMYNDGSGATGDLYYRDGSGSFTSLRIGSTGQMLRVSGGLPAWSSNLSGTFATGTETSNYTITSSDTVILVNAGANTTITLPAASGMTGYRFYIKRIDNPTDGFTVTIGRTGTDLIDGMTSFTLDMQYTAIGVISNGSAWYIL